MRFSRNLSYENKPRIYVILRGGLGNQLHQIAAGVKFAEEHGGKLVIFPHIVDTAINLDRRGFFREIDLEGLFPGINIRETNAIENAFLRLLNFHNFKYLSRIIITEENFTNPPKRSVYFTRGWFQSFEFIPSRINYLALREQGLVKLDDVVLHVRLTDFLTIDSNPLGEVYYFKALSIAMQKMSVGILKCFSDDIENAEKLLPLGFKYEFPEAHGPFSATKLLSRLSNSRILICSKSSLCWWAANSVSANGGVVVSPWIGSTHKSEWLRVKA